MTEMSVKAMPAPPKFGITYSGPALAPEKYNAIGLSKFGPDCIPPTTVRKGRPGTGLGTITALNDSPIHLSFRLRAAVTIAIATAAIEMPRLNPRLRVRPSALTAGRGIFLPAT